MTIDKAIQAIEEGAHATWWGDEFLALLALLKDTKAEVERLRGELVETKSQKDAAYAERNRVVAALAASHPSGIARTAIEGWSDDWHGCVYIDLPTGQASWHYHDSHAWMFAHLPPYTKPWDGHDTALKYQRVASAALAGKEVGK